MLKRQRCASGANVADGMIGRSFKDETVYLGEVAKGMTVIEDWTFTRCQIRGPIIIAALDRKTTFENCNLGGTQEQILWVISPDRRNIQGALGLTDCRFLECVFQNVGFAGHPDVIDRMRQGLTWGLPPTRKPLRES